jgi:hypothetical protein
MDDKAQRETDVVLAKKGKNYLEGGNMHCYKHTTTGHEVI